MKIVFALSVFSCFCFAVAFANSIYQSVRRYEYVLMELARPPINWWYLAISIASLIVAIGDAK